MRGVPCICELLSWEESASEIPLNTLNLINIMKQIRGPNRSAIFKNRAYISFKCTAKKISVLRYKSSVN